MNVYANQVVYFNSHLLEQTYRLVVFLSDGAGTSA